MSYTLEWLGGVVVFEIVILLLLVPWFAVIAVLVVAFTALVVLVALAAAAVASPYVLVRTVRRRLAQRSTRWIYSPSGIRSGSAGGSPAALARARVTAFAHAAPDEAGTILNDATRDPA